MLAQRAAHRALDGADQPGRAVRDDQQRSSQPALTQPGQKARPGIPGLARGGLQPDKHRFAVGVDAPGGQHRLGRGVGVVLEMAAVQKQESNSTASSRRWHQVSNCSLISVQMRDTVDFDTAACSPSASVNAASTSRVDSPRRNPAITSDSSALVLVTPLPNSCEANRSVVLRSFGWVNVIGPAVVFTVVGQYPLSIPARGSSLTTALS